MSGYYTRKPYDQCYNIEFINQQVNPCKYRIEPNYGENNSRCQTVNGPRSNKKRSTGELGNTDAIYRTDIESQLFNLDIPDSRCVTMKTMKEKNERLAKVAANKNIEYNMCNKIEDINYTRLDNPANNLRSVYINRYDFPIIDPTEFVYYGITGTSQINNNRFGENSQLTAKDNISAPNYKPFSLLTN